MMTAPRGREWKGRFQTAVPKNKGGSRQFCADCWNLEIWKSKSGSERDSFTSSCGEKVQSNIKENVQRRHGTFLRNLGNRLSKVTVQTEAPYNTWNPNDNYTCSTRCGQHVHVLLPLNGGELSGEPAVLRLIGPTGFDKSWLTVWLLLDGNVGHAALCSCWVMQLKSFWRAEKVWCSARRESNAMSQHVKSWRFGLLWLVCLWFVLWWEIMIKGLMGRF